MKIAGDGGIVVQVIWWNNFFVINNPLFVEIFLLFHASLSADQENEDGYKQKTRSWYAENDTETIWELRKRWEDVSVFL